MKWRKLLRMVCSESLGKYLGLPVIWERSKDEALALVRDRLIKKIHRWKNCLLSQTGREVLIKATDPSFPMFCFKFSKKKCGVNLRTLNL